ncbi:Uu.00g031270.m01.CDS01 [Anthostomella pinea]|uniref:Uu.00g031270.m01.CDS01 n=1 Tax=Anthostomella pinea TaxID=933095 RepID=A0AAI8V8B4_9PEZI|nr:Uu.00g031270.m01.CDS01 [Anthostomella pinea]
MASRVDSTMPSTRRPRKSTGHSPVRKRMEKENITVDVASTLAGNGGRKKSRSKSVGPGGLDILKSGSGNRRVSMAAPVKPPPRSILKPTIPPLPEIPPHKPKFSVRRSLTLEVQGGEKLSNPFQNDDSSSSGTKIALRTEEEQQAAAREREERERAALEKEIKDRREARRKSLANRRVSFAAEATLHTFHEIEYMQDSTTSTDSTRRASSLAAQSPAVPDSNAQPSDPPSTPPEQVEDIVPDSPEHQRDLHQKKRRRSSVSAPLEYNNPDDLTLASSVYSSDSDGADGVIEAEVGSDSGSDSDADGVSMDLDVDEMTGTSMASAMSARSGFTEDSNDTLDGALRLATRRAETQQLDEEEEIIPSFAWAKKPAPKQASPARDQESVANGFNGGDDEDSDEDDMEMDMDMTSAVGGIIEARDDSQDDIQEEEMSMDVTRALGGILPQRTKQMVAQSASLESPGDGSLMEDSTMDLTRAIGVIRKTSQPENDLIEYEEDEDMSMELTTIMGGVLPTSKPNPVKRRPLGRRRTMAGDDEATMDMTVGLGRILPPDQDDGEDEDATMGMEMTMAMGGIIKGPSPLKDRTQAKQLMELEADNAGSTPVLSSPTKRRLCDVFGTTNTSEAGSPGLSAFKGNGLRRSQNWRAPGSSQGKSPARNTSASKSATPRQAATPTTPRQSSPLRTPQQSSPLKTPQQSSPLKTPLSSKRKGGRPGSPQRPSPDRPSTTPESATHPTPKTSIFQQDPSTGVATPQVVLTPQTRRLSGVGADRPGLGSPKIAAILERRASISQSAHEFVPQHGPRVVKFADPRAMEAEVDKDLQREIDKESGRKILEREADGVDDETTTTTLKDMISNMTPKKSHLKSRKSLHVGSAKGLLGKRPAELDDEDEFEDRDGIKRLKGHQSSPVKNVRLHAPPTKEETTGHLTRSAAKPVDEATFITTTPTLRLSAQKGSKGPSSFDGKAGKARFKDVQSDEPTGTFSFDDAPAMADPEAEGEHDDGERIQLQDFLNMTSIRFMELTTTKRRHTQAPTIQKGFFPEKEDISLERCVVAGVCTVPMLELYQHSCRELKKYISEGRRVVRGIETDTLEENPPLFREYMSATPEFKALMDNQFKNVKTHARLISKNMWYDWRTQLQVGLKQGLISHADGMIEDEKLLRKQQALLDSVLPDMVKRLQSLELERDNLESVAQELADCDPDDLQAARAELTEVDSDIQVKMWKIDDLRQQLTQTESSIGEVSQRKEQCIGEIGEAERVREECRGWTSKEISSLKARADELEEKHGWAITGIADTTISMTYRREVELVFDMSSFQGQAGAATDSRIDLWYIAANRERSPQPASPEREFFVQCIRDHVRAMGRPHTSPHTNVHIMLDAVSAAWQKANHVVENVRLLNCTFPTNVTRTSDSSIAVSATLLLSTLETKVVIVLGLRGQSSRDGVHFSVVPQAQVVYGEHFKVEKLVDYLATRIGDGVVTKQENGEVESWSDVIVELHERLSARTKK